MEKTIDIAVLQSVQLFMNGKYTLRKIGTELPNGLELSHIVEGDDLLTPVCIVLNHESHAATSYLLDNEQGALISVPGDLLRDKVTDIVFELVEQIKEGMENRKEE